MLGIVYYDLSMSNLQAIQNRLGAFLLSCVFLCFTSVSALPVRTMNATDNADGGPCLLLTSGMACL